MPLKCLTESERNQWLNDHVERNSIAHEGSHPKYRLRFSAPTTSTYYATHTFARRFIQITGATSEILFNIEDRTDYTAEQEFVFSSLWKNMDESRHFTEAPACRGTIHDAELLSGFFGLSVVFWWHSSLYSGNDQTALLNWEGEYFELCTTLKSTHDQVVDMIKEWRLTLVEEKS